MTRHLINHFPPPPYVPSFSRSFDGQGRLQGKGRAARERSNTGLEVHITEPKQNRLKVQTQHWPKLPKDRSFAPHVPTLFPSSHTPRSVSSFHYCWTKQTTNIRLRECMHTLLRYSSHYTFVNCCPAVPCRALPCRALPLRSPTFHMTITTESSSAEKLRTVTPSSENLTT